MLGRIVVLICEVVNISGGLRLIGSGPMQNITCVNNPRNIIELDPDSDDRNFLHFWT